MENWKQNVKKTEIIIISVLQQDSPAVRLDKFSALVVVSERAEIKALSAGRTWKTSQHPLQGSLRKLSSRLKNLKSPHFSILSIQDLLLLPKHHPRDLLPMLRCCPTNPGNLPTALTKKNPTLWAKEAQFSLKLLDQLKLR